MSEALRLLKKYPNRRLYDTHSSAYVTLDDVRKLVVDGERFKVVDAKSGSDLTHGILLQIVCDEESAGGRILSDDFLEQLIRAYGKEDPLAVGRHLDDSWRAFAGNASGGAGGGDPVL